MPAFVEPDRLLRTAVGSVAPVQSAPGLIEADLPDVVRVIVDREVDGMALVLLVLAWR